MRKGLSRVNPQALSLGTSGLMLLERSARARLQGLGIRTWNGELGTRAGLGSKVEGL